MKFHGLYSSLISPPGAVKGRGTLFRGVSEAYSRLVWVLVFLIGQSDSSLDRCFEHDTISMCAVVSRTSGYVNVVYDPKLWLRVVVSKGVHRPEP